MTLINSLLDWVYPPTCMACRALLPLNAPSQLTLHLCPRCADIFEPIAAPVCPTCGVPTELEVKSCAACIRRTFRFDTNRAAFIYEETVRDLLLELKFHNKKRIAQGLGKLWAAYIKSNRVLTPSLENSPILVPLPMHPKKQRERGFNQAEILATAVSESLNIPAAPVLVRTMDTPPQSGLHPSLRAENVKGVFAVQANINTEGKHYILVDDIFTTGASLNECAIALKKSGAAQVSCMTLAISVKNKINS